MTNKTPEQKFDEWLALLIENNLNEQAKRDYAVNVANFMDVGDMDIDELSSAIRKALDIEVVDDESEPIEGDLVKLDGWWHTAVSREVYTEIGRLYGKRAHFVELDCIADFSDKEQLKWFHNADEGNGIAQRNNKLVINIDKLRGDND